MRVLPLAALLATTLAHADPAMCRARAALAGKRVADAYRLADASWEGQAEDAERLPVSERTSPRRIPAGEAISVLVHKGSYVVEGGSAVTSPAEVARFLETRPKAKLVLIGAPADLALSEVLPLVRALPRRLSAGLVFRRSFAAIAREHNRRFPKAGVPATTTITGAAKDARHAYEIAPRVFEQDFFRAVKPCKGVRDTAYDLVKGAGADVVPGELTRGLEACACDTNVDAVESLMAFVASLKSEGTSWVPFPRGARARAGESVQAFVDRR